MINFNTPAIKVLFICAYGEVRSPTASEIWSKEFATDYIGVTNSRRYQRREKLLWCDLAITMSSDISRIIMGEFPNFRKPMYNAKVEDTYGVKNHPDLIKKLKKRIEPVLAEYKWSATWKKGIMK